MIENFKESPEELKIMILNLYLMIINKTSVVIKK